MSNIVYTIGCTRDERRHYIMEGCYGMSCYGARRFLTKEEKIEMLNEYKERLDLESKGVAERIAALQKEAE